MRILAIETSGPTFSLALAENSKVVSEIFWHSGLKHSEQLVPSLRKLLKRAGWKVSSIDKVAVSTGPGSFTGIRVGLSCAKTIAQALKVPLAAFNSIDILKSSMPEKGNRVFGVIDALRNEVFVKDRSGKVVIKNSQEYWEELKHLKSRVNLIGSAVITHKNEIRNILGKYAIITTSDNNYPKAGVLALMADKMPGKNYKTIEPLYVRRSWAEERRH